MTDPDVEALAKRLGGVEITAVRANRALMGTTPVTKANEDAREAASTIRAQAAEIERLREALTWYRDQARMARLIHSEGDAGRHALADDGGDRASAALKREAGT